MALVVFRLVRRAPWASVVTRAQLRRTFGTSMAVNDKNSSQADNSSKSSMAEQSTKSSDVKQRMMRDASHPNTPLGMLDRTPKAGGAGHGAAPDGDHDPFAPFPDAVNPATNERGGPTGPEPTRYGDWERKGRVTDF